MKRVAAGGVGVGEGQWVVALLSSVETLEITVATWGTTSLIPPSILPSII